MDPHEMKPTHRSSGLSALSSPPNGPPRLSYKQLKKKEKGIIFLHLNLTLNKISSVQNCKYLSINCYNHNTTIPTWFAALMWLLAVLWVRSGMHESTTKRPILPVTTIASNTRGKYLVYIIIGKRKFLSIIINYVGMIWVAWQLVFSCTEVYIGSTENKSFSISSLILVQKILFTWH